MPIRCCARVRRSVRAVDAVQLLDAKQPHISGLAAAALLIGNGVDPVVHMNCRDRNRLALQKDLLGAAALGVTSVLIARGAKIPKSGRVGRAQCLRYRPRWNSWPTSRAWRRTRTRNGSRPTS